jgi:hypothetical protein
MVERPGPRSDRWHWIVLANSLADGKGPDRGLASSNMAEPAVRLLTVACTGAKHSEPCGQRSDDAIGVLKQKS